MSGFAADVLSDALSGTFGSCPSASAKATAGSAETGRVASKLC